MGILLSIGGIAGSVSGVSLFERLLALGQLDLMISLLYVVFLAIIGALMLAEALRADARTLGAMAVSILRRPARTVAHRLPFRMRFPRSGLYISVIPPLLLGFGVGALAAIMGVGGGFVAHPGDDLSSADAHQRRHRHVAVSDSGRHRRSSSSCNRRRRRRSISCWRRF